jgi:hypothetical protein
MKVFAHLSPTVPAIFVAAMVITLSVFLLHGAWVQGEPTPVLAAVGGAAARVVADLPATVDHPASEPVREVASSAQFDAPPSEHFVPLRQQAATNAHRVHPRARIGVARRAPTAAPRAASPPEPATQVTMDKSFAKAPGKARGHGHGHGHGHGQKWTADARAPGAHGHGKAFGHSSEHHHGLARGHAKHAPSAPSPSPTTPPKVHGGGNGHKGGKK